MSKTKLDILFLADADSSHTYKWVSAIAGKIQKIGLFSFRKATKYNYPDNVALFFNNKNIENSSDFVKLGYLSEYRYLKKIIAEKQPSYLHAFYATSYGLIGALQNHPKFYISTWGSDIYEFPNKSWLHKNLLKYNLNKAYKTFATSIALTNETKKYTKKTVITIPFGVNIDYFKPSLIKKEKQNIVFGTVKSLNEVYNIDGLLKAFHQFLILQPDKKKYKLIIAGDGPKKQSLEKLVRQLGISKNVSFLGYIPQQNLLSVYHKIDIFMILSKRESFGVAAVEASACGIPIIASDIEGLNEVVKDNFNGLLVNINNIDSIVNAMQHLADKEDLRAELAKNGRILAEEKYNFKENVNNLLTYYSL